MKPDLPALQRDVRQLSHPRWFSLVFASVFAVSLVIVTSMAAGGAPRIPVAGSPTPSAGTAVASPAASPAVASGHVTVTIHDFFFAPAKIIIKVGTTVTWINDGPTVHTVLAQKGPNTIFGSNLLVKGQSYSYTFRKAGTFPYICGLHPNMKAVVIVVQ